MSQHRATVEWKREGDFVYKTYSRMHEVRFESGVRLPGRAAPCIDPEEAFLERTWMSKVTLRPRVTLSGSAPSDEQHRALHRKAHEKCFIANSVKSEVTVEPSIDQR